LFAGRKDPVNSAIPIDGKIDTIIGRDAHIKGTVTATGLIRIDGRVEGEVLHQGDVAIGESGNVAADIKARNVTIAGTVTGNVEASGKLELLGSARLTGDIVVASLVIGEGALFKGSSEMKAPEKVAVAGRGAKVPDKDSSV